MQITLFHPRQDPSFRLFCFPFAGGRSAMYRPWSKLLPENIEVCPFQYPGRSAGEMKQSYRSINILVEAMADLIQPFLNLPFAFFGHSMGSLVSFELARLFRAKKWPMPSALFVSAFRAPHLSLAHHDLHRLPNEDLIKKVGEYQGTPMEVMAHPELIKLLLPILREDLRLIETYHYQAQTKLHVPIFALGGENDPEVSIEHLEAWNIQSALSFEMKVFSGHHFYINDHLQSVVKYVSDKIKLL